MSSVLNGRCLILFCCSALAAALGNLDASISRAASVAPVFDEFIKIHGRNYELGSAEYVKRRQLYEERVRANDVHNLNADRMWTAGVNIMSDRTSEEIASFNGYRKNGHHSVGGPSSLISVSENPGERELGYVMPKDFSWESADIDGDKQAEKVEALTNIRSQRCGNCWAAATNAMMEAHRQLHGGVVVKFDDNELTQCSENFFHCGGNGGCEGSTPELALMHYVKNGIAPAQHGDKLSCPKTRPIVDKKELPPHELQDGIRNAAANSPARHFGMIGWEKLPENQGLPIMLALYERGPVAVAVSTDGWHQYESGVYGGCGQDAVIGHSVLAIGFGQVKFKGETVKYWRLQNSWGPSFGEQGHFRLLRHDRDDEYCGTDKFPQSGMGCDGGAASVKICGMCGILYDALVPYSQPETWLAKELEQRRNKREMAMHNRGGRNFHQQVIGVDLHDDDVVAAPREVQRAPAWGQLSWKMGSLVIVAVIFLVVMMVSMCKYSKTSGNESKSKAPSTTSFAKQV